MHKGTLITGGVGYKNRSGVFIKTLTSTNITPETLLLTIFLVLQPQNEINKYSHMALRFYSKYEI